MFAVYPPTPFAELSDEEALEEYEAVVIPIYEELLVGCLSNIMGDASPSDLARTYGQLMASGRRNVDQPKRNSQFWCRREMNGKVC